MKRPVFIILTSLFLFGGNVFPPASSAQGADVPVRREIKPGQQRPDTPGKLLAMQLQDDDDTVRAQALVRVKEVVDAGVQIDDRWLQALMAQNAYDTVDALAAQGIVNWPETGARVASLQKQRVDALRANGKKDAALAAAKAYYNVCDFKDTEGAIDLLVQCLREARPDDAKTIQRFQAQQLAWASAATQPGAAGNELGDNILNSIQVDGKAFEQIANQLKDRDFDSLMGRGNLLLLADKPAEARQAFETALHRFKEPNLATPALEGVARAIRAQAGAVGPANAYILARQTGG